MPVWLASTKYIYLSFIASPTVNSLNSLSLNKRLRHVAQCTSKSSVKFSLNFENIYSTLNWPTYCYSKIVVTTCPSRHKRTHQKQIQPFCMDRFKGNLESIRKWYQGGIDSHEMKSISKLVPCRSIKVRLH